MARAQKHRYISEDAALDALSEYFSRFGFTETRRNFRKNGREHDLEMEKDGVTLIIEYKMSRNGREKGIKQLQDYDADIYVLAYSTKTGEIIAEIYGSEGYGICFGEMAVGRIKIKPESNKYDNLFGRPREIRAAVGTG